MNGKESNCFERSADENRAETISRFVSSFKIKIELLYQERFEQEVQTYSIESRSHRDSLQPNRGEKTLTVDDTIVRSFLQPDTRVRYYTVGRHFETVTRTLTSVQKKIHTLCT